MYKIRFPYILVLACCLISFGQSPEISKWVRPVVDTVGFAQYGWQMDSIIKRLDARIKIDSREEWKTVIAPHDDYKYAGEVTYRALSGIRAKTVILFGVAHKAKQFNLENKLIFGSFTLWNAPYGDIPISGLQREILKKLPADLWMVHDSMQRVEHSLEALIPFIQHQNREAAIIPIIVPYMDFARMVEISEALGTVLADLIREKKLDFGHDIAIAISNDAVHYGDEDWGGKNMAPFGSDSLGNARAGRLEREIIDSCLVGDITADKVNRFVRYTVKEEDYHEYKWTWCGRYAVPLGLLTAGKLNDKLLNQPLQGHFLSYANSIDHPFYPVEDLGMGTTAPANSRHWVGYVAIGYK